MSALPLESAGMSGAQSPSEVKSQVKRVAAAPWREVLPATRPAPSPRPGLAIGLGHTAPYKVWPGLPFGGGSTLASSTLQSPSPSPPDALSWPSAAPIPRT